MLHKRVQIKAKCLRPFAAPLDAAREMIRILLKNIYHLNLTFFGLQIIEYEYILCYISYIR